MIANRNDLASCQTPEGVVSRLAETEEDRRAAFQLVHQAYIRAGLASHNDSGMRITPYHLLPTTEVFVTAVHGEVVSTMSLVVDSEIGLPMESVYPYEVGVRRASGKRLAEVTSLADRRKDFRRSFPAFLQMCQVMSQVARDRGVDQLVIVVHPRHAKLYQRLMAFRPMGPERTYPAVKDRPAVALYLDFALVDHESPHRYERFIGQPLAKIPAACPMPSREQDIFRPLIDRSFEIAYTQ